MLLSRLRFWGGSAKSLFAYSGALFALILLSSPSMAAIKAEGLQFPVWLVTEDGRVALAPGAEIAPGQQVSTGEGGKVWLRMDDGALVKLGQQADMTLQAIEAKPAKGSRTSSQPGGAGEPGFMDATLDILEGAFRYTTQKINETWKRDVRINLGSTATVGIRGTDLWGQVGPEQQFVVLLEGQIELTAREGGESVSLDTPLQIYQAADRSVGSVEMAQVQALAPETELDFGQGVMTTEGKFQLNLASFERQSQAQAASNRASQSGLATTVEVATVDGFTWYRLVVKGVPTLADGEALKDTISQVLGYDTVWLSNS